MIPDSDASRLRQIAAEGPQRLLTGVVVQSERASAWPLAERVPVRREDEVVGTLSAIVDSPRLGRTIGLAQIRRDLVESSASVVVESPHGPLEAAIHELPFL